MLVGGIKSKKTSGTDNDMAFVIVDAAFNEEYAIGKVGGRAKPRNPILEDINNYQA